MTFKLNEQVEGVFHVLLVRLIWIRDVCVQPMVSRSIRIRCNKEDDELHLWGARTLFENIKTVIP